MLESHRATLYYYGPPACRPPPNHTARVSLALCIFHRISSTPLPPSPTHPPTLCQIPPTRTPILSIQSQISPNPLPRLGGWSLLFIMHATRKNYQTLGGAAMIIDMWWTRRPAVFSPTRARACRAGGGRGPGTNMLSGRACDC